MDERKGKWSDFLLFHFLHYLYTGSAQRSHTDFSSTTEVEKIWSYKGLLTDDEAAVVLQNNNNLQ